MNISEAFGEREESLRRALADSRTPEQSVLAVQTALEQISGSLAEAEPDDLVRQTRQAVLSQMKKEPSMLLCAGSSAKLVALPAEKKNDRVRTVLLAAGALLLCCLAVFEAVSGRINFALVQALGAALLYAGCRTGKDDASRWSAEGVRTVDGEALLSRTAELCRAADVCVSDLVFLEKENRLPGTGGAPDDAVLDFLCDLLEVRTTGKPENAVRCLDRAEQLLRMMNVETIPYSADAAPYFDVLPTLGEERTVRPALLREGKLLRRGLAVRRAEGGAGA